MIKKISICGDLLDKNGSVEAWKYCAPIFIASTHFGVYLASEEDLRLSDGADSPVRSGTVTFISYKGQFFAATCKHVVEALTEARRKWRERTPYARHFPVEGFQLFTATGTANFHFNYELTPVTARDDGRLPDLAIARIRPDTFQRINRKPVLLTKKANIPGAGLAVGYPEQQRKVVAGEHMTSLSPRGVHCVAKLVRTARGDWQLEDIIERHNEVDNLSGMSGGPIFWVDSNRFGLAGIVYRGADIQPKSDSFNNENSICIFGEPISAEDMDHWLPSIPPLAPLKDETKALYIPSSMR